MELAERGLRARGDAVDTAPRGRCRTEIVGIQYLRGVAALFVVVFHISLQLNLLAGLPTLSTLVSGVDLFFVISGFVMVYSTRMGHKSSSSDFILKRFIRIAPLYWAATLFMITVMIVTPQLVKSSKLTLSFALASIALVAHEIPATPKLYGALVAPGWTLELEMIFYLLFAAGLGLGRRGWPVILVSFAAIALLSTIGLAWRPAGAVGFYTNPIMLEFCYGMLIGALFLQPTFHIGEESALLLFGLGALLLLYPHPSNDLTLRCFWFGLPALMIVASALFVPFPEWRFLHLVGDASYSIYLSHFFVLSALAQAWKKLHLLHGIGPAALYPVALLTCIAVGWGCWRLVELPLTRATRRLLFARHKIASAH